MLSKLSRFLTIATLTTLTCIFTHPSNAKIVEIENTGVGADSSVKVEKLIANACLVKAEDVNNNNVEQDNTLPANSSSENSLLLYAMISDYYHKVC